MRVKGQPAVKPAARLLVSPRSAGWGSSTHRRTAASERRLPLAVSTRRHLASRAHRALAVTTLQPRTSVCEPWASTSGLPSPSGVVRAAHEPAGRLEGFPSSSGFVDLLQAYRATGGIAPGDVLGHLFEEHHVGNFVSLARLLANGQVFALAWSHSLWIPMFQFHPGDLSIKTTAQIVRAELPATTDGWGFSAWFATHNEQLDGQRPVDLLDSQLPAVMEAARGWATDHCKRPIQGRTAPALAPA